MKKVIATPEAPAALGPYSQAIAFQNMLFCAGQIPIVAETGELLAGDVAAQTAQALKNLGAVLHASGMSYSNVVKTTVYLTDLADFNKMNEVYAQHFTHQFPARSTIQVSALPKGANVEIEAIAMATLV
jgi:2-iminobutanoate/2-iminopropanoate deaminase